MIWVSISLLYIPISFALSDKGEHSLMSLVVTGDLGLYIFLSSQVPISFAGFALNDKAELIDELSGDR